MVGSKVACEGTDGGSMVGTSEPGTYLQGMELTHSTKDQEGSRVTYVVFCFSLIHPSNLSFSIHVTFDDRAGLSQMVHFRWTPLVGLPQPLV